MLIKILRIFFSAVAFILCSSQFLVSTILYHIDMRFPADIMFVMTPHAAIHDSYISHMLFCWATYVCCGMRIHTVL